MSAAEGASAPAIAQAKGLHNRILGVFTFVLPIKQMRTCPKVLKLWRAAPCAPTEGANGVNAPENLRCQDRGVWVFVETLTL